MLWWWVVSTTGLLVNKSAFAVRYPNEIVDAPIVTCEPDKVVVKIRTSTANPSTIYAEDFHHSPNCAVRDENTILIRHGECGMTTEHMDNPSGIMYRICISVQIHPLFVTDSDRSYCAQCVYMDNSVVDDLEQNIAISEIAPSELEPQFDEASSPQCAYSIRKGSFDGPEVHAAVVGETVFHVWRCGGNGNIGILVQNCHVEDLQGNRILIIDQNGCGIDSTVFRTPQYSTDLQTAFLESNVFKFVDKSMTRFRCQLRLCVKNRGGGCEQITPPTACPNFEDADEEIRVNQVEDISDQTKTSAPRPEALPNGPPAPPPPVAAASPTHRQQRPPTTPTPLGPRSYGLSTAHVVDRSGQAAGRQQISPYAQSRTKRSSTTLISAVGGILSRRPRRAISVGGGKAEDGELPELDVVGLIRVLDNPEDLQFLDDRSEPNSAQSAGGGPSDEQNKCIPSRLYWLLIGAVGLLVGVQLVVVGMCVMQRVNLNRHQRPKWMR